MKIQKESGDFQNLEMSYEEMKALSGKLFIAAIFTSCISYIFFIVDSVQTTPYMDEAFHIPQARNYCNGSFNEWDPMITTPPGLYLISVGLLKPVSSLLDVDMIEICSTKILRSTNIFFAVGNFFVFDALIRKKNHYQNGSKHSKELVSIMSALSLSTFPVLFFFSFLYYTDMGSTFFVLLSYLVCLQGNHLLAAVFCTISLFFRQTNIVWTVFFAGVTFVKLLERDVTKSQNKQLKSLIPAVKLACSYILNLRNIPTLILLLLPYGIVVVLFVAFIFVNKGIVLGDKQHHQAVLHIPQLFYFFAFTCGFAIPFLVTAEKIKGFFKFCLNNLMLVVLVCVFALLAVYQFTYAHKYLLSDNRHITFYLWMRVFQRHFTVRYLLIPGYLYAGWSIHDTLSIRPPLWRLLFTICLIVATVPQKLLELRYFILPYLIFRLNIPSQSLWKYLLELLFYCIINSMVLLLFLQKTFHWEGNTDVQRIMW